MAYSYANFIEEGFTMIFFLTHFFIKCSGSQTFCEKPLAPFLEKYQHYWLNHYLLWSSITG
jgi:hypothetical protein